MKQEDQLIANVLQSPFAPTNIKRHEIRKSRMKWQGSCEKLFKLSIAQSQQ